MSRGSGLCIRCGGVKRGRAARTASPIALCAECREPVCGKHSTWDSEREGYICRKHERDRKGSSGPR